MKNPILKEVRRVTGWHTLIDHEAFPLLLAAASTTVIFGLFPGVSGLLGAYHMRAAQTAALYMTAPTMKVVNVSAPEANQMLYPL
jgi:hypothetical protein